MDEGAAAAIVGIIVLLVFAVLPIILKVCGIGAKRVSMKNPTTGQIKSGFYGFSWTYFFFGWWVPLLRGELGVAALHLLFSIFTLGIWQIIVSFMYNRQYTSRLIEAGYRFFDKPEINQDAAAYIGVDLDVHRQQQMQAR
jgi:hypothetical protein